MMKKHTRTLFALFFGTFLMAVAINGLLAPHNLLSGGVSGFALMLHFLFDFKLSILTVLLNIPLFLLALKFLRKQFITFSLIGMCCLSFWIEVTHGISIPTENTLSIILLAGLLNGVGMGIIFREGGSVGGTDIIAKIINQSFSLSMASVIFSINIVIMAISVYFFGVDSAVLTAASMFVSTQTTNFVVDGLNRRRTVTIVTSPERGNRIATEIMSQMQRGVTIVPALGGYTHADKAILYTTINLREVARLKGLVCTCDPHAFMTVADTAQVIGHGRGFIPPEAN